MSLVNAAEEIRRIMTPDDITTMLSNADPGAISNAERAALHAMVRTTTGRGRLRRFAPRSAATIMITGALIAVGGAAAAATLSVWQPWAQHPDLTAQYTMTDGQQCEYRIVFEPGTTEAARTALTEAFTNPEVLTPAAVDAAIAAIRADPGAQRDADTGEPMGYGTAHYNAEWEYFNAVNAVVLSHVSDLGASQELATRGQAECE